MDPDFTVNDDLGTYTPEEIDALIEAGNAALDVLFAIEAPTDADVAEAQRVAGLVVNLSDERDSRLTAASDRAAAMSALRDSREPAEEEPVEEVIVEDEPIVEAAVEEVVVTPVTPIVAPVAASVRRIAATRTVRPKVPAKPNASMSITASADVPDFAVGSAIGDMATLTTAVINRMTGFPAPAGIEGGQMQKYSVASFRKQFPTELVADRDRDDFDVVEAAARESRLPGGSLTAAGGWCSPSETLYDFCTGETTDGLLSLPEIQVKRGGVKYTKGPDFATLYANTGFTQTEAQAIAGVVKTCYEVPCPTFTDVRLDAIGLCIKVPILTNAAYPELVQRVISGSLIAQQHRVSVALINKMVTASGAALATNGVGAVSTNTLDAVELIVAQTRQDYRLSLSANLEVIAPFWLLGAIRADLAARNGVDLLAVSDAQINAYFAVRGASVQWVYNWQPLVAGEEGYPSTVQIMAYPAGTYVKGTSQVINLSAVYDAAELSVNRYTGLFAEEGILLLNRCYTSKLLTIPVCAGGVTGAASNTACFNLTP